MSAEKIKQFAKEIKEKYDYDEYNDVVKLCDMLTEAVEALESIAAIHFNFEDLHELEDYRLKECILNDTEIARESLSKLAGRLE